MEEVEAECTAATRVPTIQGMDREYLMVMRLRARAQVMIIIQMHTFKHRHDNSDRYTSFNSTGGNNSSSSYHNKYNDYLTDRNTSPFTM